MSQFSEFAAEFVSGILDAPREFPAAQPDALIDGPRLRRREPFPVELPRFVERATSDVRPATAVEAVRAAPTADQRRVTGTAPSR